ncbi:expressed protein [Dictyostelium purpureum]|uniref:Expressed protein n=1 Tax=Dictyostelium purpureum TaxID=5786 RepID=F1A0L3_DICPU|nr:uncharacterized protein DICPUDRAFT_93003 [Dictyostelium purpureum]EGC30280.1 expressed protein [Dictyostelium purpureum]|eukprot:XP_003293207.1 expressed protein [Dictyostelium purpureum]
MNYNGINGINGINNINSNNMNNNNGFNKIPSPQPSIPSPKSNIQTQHPLSQSQLLNTEQDEKISGNEYLRHPKEKSIVSPPVLGQSFSFDFGVHSPISSFSNLNSFSNFSNPNNNGNIRNSPTTPNTNTIIQNEINDDELPPLLDLSFFSSSIYHPNFNKN